jgi:hypothetical protein
MIGIDGPAFIRRARRVQAEWEVILERCRKERERLLEMPRMRLAQLLAIAGSWSRVATVTGELSTARLEALHRQWRPRLRAVLPQSPKESDVLRALELCQESFDRFNGRWTRFVHQIDLAPVNRLRAGYNEWYVIEKECAVGSARTARGAFEPLPPATHEALLQRFPLLPTPATARKGGDVTGNGNPD